MSKTYSTTIEITEEKEYSVTINAGLDLSAWITAGSTTDYPLNPSSYANFAALEADEKAIRQLMLVHNAVDYLATAGADDALIEDVINSDICAKWINLSDYALDTLSANTNIKSVMDEADKYGYGEWGLVGQVPNMTSAPASGVVEASSDMSGRPGWYVFNDSYKLQDDQGWVAYDRGAQTLSYTFPESICIRRAKIVPLYTAQGGYYNRTRHYKYQAYNGSEWIDISDEFTFNASDFFEREDILSINGVENANKYTKYRLYVFSDASTISVGCNHLQFLAYAPIGNVPIMTANNAPYGVAFASSNHGNYPAYKAFDGIDVYSHDWETSSTSLNEYIGYIFTNPTIIKSIYCGNRTGYDQYITQACEWLVEGSNDTTTGLDGNWTQIGSFTQPADSQRRYYNISNDMAYRAYRIKCNTAGGNYNNVVVMQVLQFYGRELIERGIPTMTSNTSPYGEASVTGNTEGQAFYLFDGNTSTRVAATGAAYQATDALNVDYDFGQLTLITGATITLDTASTHFGGDVKLYGYVNGQWSELSSVSYTKTEATSVKVTKTFSFTPAFVEQVRFSAPAAQRDDTGYSIPSLYEATCMGYTFNLSEKEFAQGSTRKTIYDHGVEPYTQVKTYTYGSGELAEKLSDRLHLYQPSQNQSIALVYIENEDVHTYTMFAKVGSRLQILGGAVDHIRMSFMTILPTDSYIVTDGAMVIIKPPLTDTKVSLSGENTYTTNPAIRINTYSSSAGGEIDIKEWWLE